MSYTAIVESIPEPDYKEKKLVDSQTTKDIIADLIYCFKTYNYQASEAYKVLFTDNIDKDARNIYDFIKTNIHYEAEPFEKQTTASFSKIIHDKQGDCKHSALIVSCLGWQMGYNAMFRFVDYHGTGYGHVYVLLQHPETKKNIIIDPLQNFNSEKGYKRKLDYIAKQNLNDMSLTRMTGVADKDIMGMTKIMSGQMEVMNGITFTPLLAEDLKMAGIGSLKSFFKKLSINNISKALKQVSLNNAGAALKQVSLNNIKKDATHLAQQVEQVGQHVIDDVKLVALTPIRLAFQAILLANFNDMAGRLKKAIDLGKDAELKGFAKTFGYINYDHLKSQIAAGAKNKPLFGGEHVSGVVFAKNGIGQFGEGIVAAVAAAAPAIIAIIKILQKLNLFSPKDNEVLNNAAATLASLPGTNMVNPVPYVPPTGTAADIVAAGGTFSTVDTPNGTSTTVNVQTQGIMETIKEHPVVTAIISGGIIYFGGKAFKLW